MPEQTGSASGSFLFLPIMLVMIWYVIVIRPQSKMRKEHAEMLKNIKKHEQIVTNGGMFGTVVNIKPDTITLRIDENVRVEVERSAISRIVKPKGEESQPTTQKRA